MRQAFVLRRALLGGLAGLAAALAATPAQAAVFVARRVIGRVETLSQQSPAAAGASFDSATVMLEAPAAHVYAKAVESLRRAGAEGIRITNEDAGLLQVQFTNGRQVAGIKVTALGEKLSQLLVTSAHTGDQPNAAALVADSVLRVCRDLNVECSRAPK